MYLEGILFGSKFVEMLHCLAFVGHGSLGLWILLHCKKDSLLFLFLFICFLISVGPWVIFRLTYVYFSIFSNQCHLLHEDFFS